MGFRKFPPAPSDVQNQKQGSPEGDSVPHQHQNSWEVQLWRESVLGLKIRNRLESEFKVIREKVMGKVN